MAKSNFTFTVRSNKKGLDAIKKNLMFYENNDIKTGIFNKRASRSADGSDADDLATRLMFNEEGTKTSPARPSLNPAFKKKIKDSQKDNIFAERLDKNGESTSKSMKFALKAIDEVRNKMERLKTPAKKENTIRAAFLRYGEILKNPLIQTGEMQKAVSSEVGSKEYQK